MNLSMDIDLEIEKLQLKEPTESDCEREKTYLLAEDLNQNLAQMETNLKKVVADSNKSKTMSSMAISGAGDSNPVDKIVAVLNSHHDCLAWLDDKTNELNRDVSELKRSLSHIQ